MSRQVAIIGGSLTGNKGAASMVLAVIDRSRAEDPNAGFTVLSPLAGDDRSMAAELDVDLVPYGPVEIILATVGALVSRLTRGRIQPGSATRALRAADVVADVSGISFVDGRGMLTLAYNVLLVLPSVLLGRPVVKVAQAMGPFRHRANRLAARLVLRRLGGVLARGRGTREYLEELGVRHDGTAADVAFLMEVLPPDELWADAVAGNDPFVCVAPSQVVLDQARPMGIDYVDHVVAAVDALAEQRDVVLVAHSARPGRGPSKLNDLPLCEEVWARVAQSDRCRVAPADATPRQLRALIGRSELLVTSRFHAMISGLAMGVPVLVIGWSHKYREVLADFGVEELALDFRHVDRDGVGSTARDVHGRRSALAGVIANGLPPVLASAERSLVLLREEAVLNASSTLPPAHERRAP